MRWRHIGTDLTACDGWTGSTVDYALVLVQLVTHEHVPIMLLSSYI